MGFMCAECGGNVADNQRVGPDATWTLRGGATIPFPQTVRLPVCEPVCEKCGERYLSKLAIDAVETALSEMHDALSAHFAPVLRWTFDERGTAFAELGQWRLEAGRGGWFISAETPRNGRQFVATGRGVMDRSEARRAAEAALRSLGVAFRVERES